jgi:hypothetical protein
MPALYLSTQHSTSHPHAHHTLVAFLRLSLILALKDIKLCNLSLPLPLSLPSKARAPSSPFSRSSILASLFPPLSTPKYCLGPWAKRQPSAQCFSVQKRVLRNIFFHGYRGPLMPTRRSRLSLVLSLSSLSSPLLHYLPCHRRKIVGVLYRGPPVMVP